MKRACRGDWVHVFPEGRVGYTGRLQPCKWGVGKLVCDCVQDSGRWSLHLPMPAYFVILTLMTIMVMMTRLLMITLILAQMQLSMRILIQLLVPILLFSY